MFQQNEMKEVIQFHFMQWNDFSCPEEPSYLVDFIRDVRAALPVNSGPIIVHCSAGVGRTGTFITVDRLMQHLKDHDYVDIFGLVGELRHYRAGLVQSLVQYVYVHDCVRYIINNMSEEQVNLSGGSGDDESEEGEEIECEVKKRGCRCCGLI